MAKIVKMQVAYCYWCGNENLRQLENGVYCHNCDEFISTKFMRYRDMDKKEMREYTKSQSKKKLWW